MEHRKAEKSETSSTTEELLTGEIIRTGKDELNLIEHPFASMWDKEANDAVIHYEWEARHPVTGKMVQASWRVEGSPTMGLPKPSDERVYLVLLELTREAHFQNQIINFTRYDLVQRLGWADTERSYKMLYAAFERLKAVSITARNAFWEPRVKSFRNVGFSIIDNFDIINEKPGRKPKNQDQVELPVSYFRWNDVMFQSFQAGYMRTLDLGLALSLKGDIALRLYRYLDKKAYDGRSRFEIELGSLCERHLGMRPARFPSKHKERLKGAHEELMARGVLAGVSYEPMKTKKAEKVCYSFPSKTPALPADESDATADEAAPAATATPELLQQMLDLKISPDVARDLLASTPAEALQLQLDCLQDRKAQDPAAVFVKAVREGWEPPQKYFERVEAAERAKKAKAVAEAQKSEKAAQEAKKRQETASQEQQAAALDAMWEKLDARTRERLENQVREKLEASEFLRARIQAGKLTPESPDWVKARHDLLRETLGKTT
jgi:hypothetical protein